MWTIEVCEECLLAHAGVLEGTPEGYTWQPLSQLDGLRVMDGCTTCPPCACGYEDPVPVCQCGYGDRGHGFGREACDGCGATWGGNRYPLVVEELEA